MDVSQALPVVSSFRWNRQGTVGYSKSLAEYSHRVTVSFHLKTYEGLAVRETTVVVFSKHRPQKVLGAGSPACSCTMGFWWHRTDGGGNRSRRVRQSAGDTCSRCLVLSTVYRLPSTVYRSGLSDSLPEIPSFPKEFKARRQTVDFLGEIDAGEPPDSIRWHKTADYYLVAMKSWLTVHNDCWWLLYWDTRLDIRPFQGKSLFSAVLRVVYRMIVYHMIAYRVCLPWKYA